MGSPRDVVGGTPEQIWRADARVCVSLWCRAWAGCRMSVKAELPNVGCTGCSGFGPQLVVLELMQLGKCGVD